MFVANVKMGGTLRAALKSRADIKCGALVGFFEGAKYTDGTSVAYVAYLNEYGSTHNPPRPFMQKTVDKEGRKWVQGIEKVIIKYGVNQPSVTRAFEMAAQVAVGNIRRSIAEWPDGDPRKNDPKTIERKRRRGDGSTNPEKALIDSGTMVASVSYEVNR